MAGPSQAAAPGVGGRVAGLGGHDQAIPSRAGCWVLPAPDSVPVLLPLLTPQ